MALEIEDDAGAGVMPLSVTVDRKGVVKVAGTFVDGTSVSASSVLYEGIDQSMCAFVSISPKAWAQGAMSLEFSFEPDEEGMPAAVYCIGSAAKYILANGDYRGIAVDGEFGYAYSPLSWVDASLPSEGTCLSVVCDNDAFEEVWFAWKTKGGPASPEIVGVGRRLSGPNMTFRLDDKTGLFSGTCGKYKIFGAMMEGTCFGEGTVIGPDGSVGKVYVDSCWY